MSHTPEEQHYLTSRHALHNAIETYKAAQEHVIAVYVHKHFPGVRVTVDLNPETLDVEIDVTGPQEESTCREIGYHVQRYMAPLGYGPMEKAYKTP